MMIHINNIVPYVGILACVSILIAVRYRTIELDSTLIFYLFIISFGLLIDADLSDNGFIPVFDTVTARVIQLFIVGFIVSMLGRFTTLRHKYVDLKAEHERLKQTLNK